LHQFPLQKTTKAQVERVTTLAPDRGLFGLGELVLAKNG
jgi:hypothetical protein